MDKRLVNNGRYLEAKSGFISANSKPPCGRCRLAVGIGSAIRRHRRYPFAFERTLQCISKNEFSSPGAAPSGSHLCERLLERGGDVVCVDEFFTGARRDITRLIAYQALRPGASAPGRAWWMGKTGGEIVNLVDLDVQRRGDVVATKTNVHSAIRAGADRHLLRGAAQARGRNPASLASCDDGAGTVLPGRQGAACDGTGGVIITRAHCSDWRRLCGPGVWGPALPSSVLKGPWSKSIRRGSRPCATCRSMSPAWTGWSRKNIEASRLQFTDDLAKALKDTQAVFIAVGTPTRRGDGQRQVERSCEAQ
jgi:UDP-glucose/GDP-mannose dehydrogenase family, NAD binding domain